MQKFIYLFSALLLGASTAVTAQDIKVQGTVKDDKDRPLDAANVSLLNAADSSWVATEVTTQQGAFSFNDVKQGKYLINVQAIGYNKIMQLLEVNDKVPSLQLIAVANANALKEVVVSSKAPRIESGLGKTIVNLEQATTTAGTTVLDLLRKSPGVVVDANGNINLKGVEAMVLVDDKQTYLSGTQLADYLKSLPAESIAKLELITQPSSKYDAEGSGGIINIKTRRTRKKGYQGNISLAGGQNVYPNTNNTANFSYRNNKTTVYANAGYWAGNGFVNRKDTRTVTDKQTGAIVNQTEQKAFRHEIFSDQNLKLGADHAITEKAIVGASVKGIYHPNDEVDMTNTKVTDAANKTIYNNTENKTGLRRDHYLANVYGKYEPAKGQEITMDLDHFYRRQDNYQIVSSDNYDDQLNHIPGAQQVRNQSPSRIQATVAKADYSGTVLKKYDVEAGVKSSFADVDNRAYFQVQDAQGNWVNDAGRTNEYLYKENINAAYVNATRDLGKKWKAQVGVRVENTNNSGHELTQNKEFERTRTDVFPTAFVSYQPSEKHGWEVSAGRRINRPSYTELSPFVTIFSQYYYYTGNPDLKPSFRNYAEVKYNYDNVVFVTGGYRKVRSLITPDIRFNPATSAIYATYGNYADRDVVAGSVVISDNAFKWWLISFSADCYYNDFQTTDGSGERATSFGYSANITNQFTFGKGWSADTTFFYGSGDLQNLIDRYLPNYWMDINLTKKFWKDTATVKVSVQDPFNFYKLGSVSDYNGIETATALKFGSQELSLGFTYNFGRKLEDVRKQRQVNSEEAGRM